MTAEVDRPDAGADGVLVAQGTQNIGFSWYIKDGRLVFDYNVFAEHQVVRSDQQVPVGKSKLEVQFIRDGRKAKITLIIDGRECGAVETPFVLRMVSSTGMDIGRDSLSPVTNDYPAPFPFTGTIHRIEVNLLQYRAPSEVKEDAETAQRTEMSRQ